MIALDTNILIYAHRQDSPWHKAAKNSISSLAEGRQGWAIAWPCLHEFLSIATNKRIYIPPSTPGEAVNQVDIWLQSPLCRLIGEANEHWLALRDLVLSARLSGGQIHDARIATICIENGVSELWTADRDFSRFPQLRTRNPLIEV